MQRAVRITTRSNDRQAAIGWADVVRIGVGWFCVVGTFVHFVANELYLLIPHTALGLESTRHFTLRMFSFISVALLTLVLLPILLTAMRTLGHKLAHIVSAASTIALSTALIDEYSYIDDPTTASDKLIAAVTVLLTVYIAIRLIVHTRRSTAPMAAISSVLRSHTALIAGITAALLFAIISTYSTPMDATYISFSRVFWNKESSILLFTFILAAALALLRLNARHIAYFSVASCIVLTGATGIMTTTARNSYCSKLRTDLAQFGTTPPVTHTPRQTGAVIDIKAAIHAQCDGSYDLPVATQ